MSKTSTFFDDLNAKIEAKQTWSAGVAFKRSNPLPLDAYSVMESQSAADNFVATSSVVYPGQIIAYPDDNNVMKVSVVSEKSDGTGYELIGVSVDVPEYVDTDTTYEFAFAKNDDDENVGLVITPKDGEAQTFLFDVYSKKVIDEKLEDTVKYVDEQIDAVEQAIGNITHFTTEIVESTDDVTEAGILYLIKDADATGTDTYKEYLFIEGTGAVCIGDTSTDLSGYYTSTETDTAIGNAIDALQLADTYVTKEYVGTIPNVPDDEGNNRYEGLDVIGYINKKAQETLDSATGAGGESAASVKNQLDTYIGTNNQRVTAIEEEIDNLQLGDKNVIESVVAAEGAKISVTTDSASKTVTINDSAIVSLINTNTTNITNLTSELTGENGIKSRLTAIELVNTQQDSDIDALELILHGKAETTEGAGDGVVGLIKKVSDAESSITTLTSDVSTLKNHNHDGKYADATHSHVIADITDLDVSAFAPKSHTHGIADISGLTEELNGKASADHTHDEYLTEITEHTHDIADVTGLSDKLAIIDTLVGTDTNKSIRTIAGEEVAKIIDDADPSDIDTLNEIAAWITNDTTGAAKMNADIQKNAQDIVALTQQVNGINLPEIATVDVAGIVKSVASTVENGVQVAADGTMSVAKVNVNTLVQTDGEELIFEAGKA